MKTVLILGVNSFSGQYLEKYLQFTPEASSYNFVGIDRELEPAINSSKISYLGSNLLDKKNLEKLLLEIQPQYIMNLVGAFGGLSYEDLYAINAGLTKNIFDLLLEHNLKIKNILLIGSAAEYGQITQLPVTENAPLNPVNLYGLTKVMQSQIAHFYYQNHGLSYVLARTFNVLGEGLSPHLSIGSFMKQIAETHDDGVIHVGNITTKRDFLAIEDAVEIYFKLLLFGVPGEVYNVCSGKSVTIESILHNLIKTSGKNIRIEVRPERIKNRDISDIYGDNAKLEQLLKHNFVTSSARDE